MMEALRSLRHRCLAACGLAALAASASAFPALAQQTLTIGAPSHPSVEVNLQAIYGQAAAPTVVLPRPGPGAGPRNLLIPNLHDPDTGKVIGEGRVSLTPPAQSGTVARVAPRPQRMDTAMPARPVVRAAPPPRAMPAPERPQAPSPPPIRPRQSETATAMARPTAPMPTRRETDTPAPPPVRALTPAPPAKPMRAAPAKPMPEAPSLPAAPVPAPPPPVLPTLPQATTKPAMPEKIAPAMPEKTTAPSRPAAIPAPPAPPSVTASRPSQADKAPTRIASLPPAGEGTFQLRFGAGSAAISTDSEGRLKQLAETLKSGEDRVQLRAYADDSGGNASKARRLSLSRALAVRSYLIENGLRSTRIDVRALGVARDGGPVDRVDVIRLER